VVVLEAALAVVSAVEWVAVAVPRVGGEKQQGAPPFYL